jgi:hypothetical protein
MDVVKGGSPVDYGLIKLVKCGIRNEVEAVIFVGTCHVRRGNLPAREIAVTDR